MMKALSSDAMAMRYSKLQWDKWARIVLFMLICKAALCGSDDRREGDLSISSMLRTRHVHLEVDPRTVQKSIAYPGVSICSDTLCLSGS